MNQKKSLSKKQLIQKLKEGTLSKEEELQFLIKVRGRSPEDARRIMNGPPVNIITDTIIHLG
jgi:hypothetical protein